METYGGVAVQLYAFLISALDEVSGQLYAPAVLLLSKQSRYLFDRRLGGPQSRSERCSKEINPALPGIEHWLSSP
jgi:hypothetical protein